MAIWDHPCEQSDTTENITFPQLQRYIETRALREEYHYTCHLCKWNPRPVPQQQSYQIPSQFFLETA